MLECRVQFPEIPTFVPNWTDWLVSWLPALEPSFKQVAKPDADTLAKLLVDITLHLQSRTDLQVSFAKVIPSSEVGVLRLVIQFDEEAVARAAFELARRLLDAALHGQTFDVNAAIETLRDLAHDICRAPVRAPWWTRRKCVAFPCVG